MPLFLIGALVGGAGVWFVSDKASDLVKWGVIGAGGYMVAKHTGVLK